VPDSQHTRTRVCLHAHRRRTEPLGGARARRKRRAFGGGIGDGAGLEEALDILVLAELHLLDERGLVGVEVLKLKRCGPVSTD
jgi:hypothetical protein